MPPCKLAHVAVQLLNAHFMVGAHISPFQHRPKGLNTIGMRLLLDIFPNGMFDNLIQRGCPPGRPPLGIIWQPHEEGSKPQRIQRLASDMEAGLVAFAQGPQAGDIAILIDQLVGFPANNIEDDGPDALEMANRRLNTLINVLRDNALMGPPVEPFPKQTTHLGDGRGLL